MDEQTERRVLAYAAGERAFHDGHPRSHVYSTDYDAEAYLAGYDRARTLNEKTENP